MKKVVILQHRLLHYRVSFFDQLRDRCLASGVELHLVHGLPTKREEAKRDAGTLPWAESVKNRVVEVGPRDLLWQPFPAHLRDAELVVLMQENRLLSNYPWLFPLGNARTRVGFWGHGRNFQSVSPGGRRERWKRYLSAKVDWWFAYTRKTKDILLDDGYPESRVTVLDNAIDNERFIADLESADVDTLSRLRVELDLGAEAPVGLFCGSLYVDKRLKFMIEAADRIRAEVSDFCLVVIGDGPSSDEISSAATTRPWLKWVGVKMGSEKAAYFRLAKVVLNPGAVGLHVLDAFCAGIPMATTVDARHGPEIAYLRNGVNGTVSTGGVEEYANEVISLLTDPVRYTSICGAASRDAQRYTLDNMVERFHAGIQQCLAMPRKARDGASS